MTPQTFTAGTVDQCGENEGSVNADRKAAELKERCGGFLARISDFIWRASFYGRPLSQSFSPACSHEKGEINKWLMVL